MTEKVKVTSDIIENEIKEIKKNLNDKFSELEIAELLKSNLFIVTFEDQTYRLVKPNTQQVAEMYEQLGKKKMELLLQEGVLPAEALKKKWKEKEIDLYETEKKLEDLQKEKEKFEFILGKMMEEENPNDNPESFREKIVAIKKEQQELNNRLMQYLDVSLENRLGVFQYMFLAYLITQKKVMDGDKETWVKAFNTYEDYLKMPAIFTNRLNVYAILIAKDEIQSI